MRRLEQADELLKRRQTAEAEVTALGRTLAEVRAQLQQQAAALQTLEEKRLLQQQLVVQCEQNQRLTQRIHSYEEQRMHLAAGEPCPLCGSTEHPWVSERPVVTSGDEALALAQVELERTAAMIAEQRALLVGLTKESEHTERDIVKGRQLLGELEERLAPLLPLVGVGTVADRLGRTAQLLAQGREQAGRLRLRIQDIERLDCAAAGGASAGGTGHCPARRSAPAGAGSHSRR
jgi:DNA repair protein SbcC/Rad50